MNTDKAPHTASNSAATPPARRSLLRYASLALATSLMTLANQARADYQETFTHTSVDNLSVGTLGWSGYLGANATDVTNLAPSGNQYLGIANSVGNPGPGKGFIAVLNNVASASSFATFTTGLNLAGADTISWNMNAGWAAYSPVRVLVQVGGSWYASNQTFVATSTSSAANFQFATPEQVAKSLTFTTSASAWRSFTIDPGVSMSVGGTTLGADLSTATVTGIGFYVDAIANSLVRIDTVAVSTSAIPEPSTCATLAGAAIGSLVILRRRRH